MTSPAWELSFQTQLQPFAQDQMDVIRLVEAATCCGREGMLLGDGLEELGGRGTAGALGSRQGGLDRRGPVGRYLASSPTAELQRCCSTTQVMMGTVSPVSFLSPPPILR